MVNCFVISLIVKLENYQTRKMIWNLKKICPRGPSTTPRGTKDTDIIKLKILEVYNKSIREFLNYNHDECFYCSQKYSENNRISRDHFYPKVITGINSDNRFNLVFCCETCNYIKGHSDPSLFLIFAKSNLKGKKFCVENWKLLRKQYCDFLENYEMFILVPPLWDINGHGIKQQFCRKDRSLPCHISNIWKIDRQYREQNNVE